MVEGDNPAVQMARLEEKVNDHDRRIECLEKKIDKIYNLSWIAVGGIIVSIVANLIKF